MAKMKSAKGAYEKAIRLDPQYAQAWCNLGEWYLVREAPETAFEHFEKALLLEPELLEALNNRVAALYELGRFKEAEKAGQDAIEVHPKESALHVNLGNVLLHSGKARPAVRCYQKALECDPSCPEAHLNLATLFGEANRYGEALAYIEHVIATKGVSAQRLATLALAQKVKGDMRAAEKTCRRVLDMQPENISAMITLAGCLSARADHRGAIKLNEQALVVNPQMPAIFSNIAFDATYLPHVSTSEIFEYHREWARHFEQPAADRVFSHERPHPTDRPLRIGYVSGDFGRHPVGFLLRDVARCHDRSKFYIHCYSMTRQGDEVTKAIRENADAWIDALLLSDDELAEQIRQDRIDILVDLSGHTAYNRLPTFVRRPAPVQATWIGYFHSTGMRNIDYFITDPFTTPKGSDQRFSETPVYLPHSRFCYSPPEYAPEVAPSPCAAEGRVTFGSFNRIEKLVEPVVESWAKILKLTPNSRLLLKSGSLDNEYVSENLRERFAAHGVESGRLILRGPSSHHEMLEQYAEIDIALDPFPFNGGMTTMEALWMGVPVVTIAGNSVVSRQTVSALSNIGLQDELAFPDVERYIAGAVALASDPQRIAALRQKIRPRMAQSPIRDAKQFSRDLETLYRRMWQAWCAGERLPSDM
jgi:protein O-GlcNAc transferase